MKRNRLLRGMAVIVFGIALYGVAMAAVDCSKIHAYRCPLAAGGPYITGLPGSVPPGVPVSASDGNGGTAGPRPSNPDGSFLLPAPNMIMPVGSIITVTVNGIICEIVVEPCPPL